MQRYPTSSIARLFGAPDAELRKLAEAGHLPPPEIDGWDLVEVVQAYVGYLRARPPEQHLSGPDLAALLGVSEQAVRDLTARGVVDKAARGVWNRDASITGYLAHLRSVASGRGGDEETATTLTAEKTRLAKAQADAQEIKNAISRGELVPASDVEAEWTGLFALFRARWLAFPARIKARLAHLPASDLVVIDREVRDTLDDLGNDRAPVAPTTDGLDHADADPGGPL